MDPNNLDVNSLDEAQLEQIVNSRQSQSEPAVNQQSIMQNDSPSSLSELTEDQLQAIVNSRPQADIDDQKTWLDDTASVAGAFVAGFHNIPKAIKFDIQSTMNSLGEFLGVLPEGEANIRNKELKAALVRSTENTRDPISGAPLRQAVKEHPLVAAGTRATGALAGEILATGPIGGGASVLAKVGRAATQGGIISGLQSEQDKGAGVIEGSLIGGGLQAAFSGIGAGFRALASSERAKEISASMIKDIAKKFNLNIDDILENGYKGKSGIRDEFAKALKTNQDKSNVLYDKFRATYGTTPASPDNFAKFVQTNAVPGKQGIRINPKGDYAALEPNNIVNKRLQQFAQEPPKTIEELMAARNVISKDIGSVSKVDPNRKQTKELLSQMRNSFESDIAVAAGQRGDDALAKYNEAKQFYKDYVVPFSDARLAEGLSNAGMDSSVLSNRITRLMADASPVRQQLAQRLVKAGGPELQTTMKMNIAGDLAAKSIKNGAIDAKAFAKGYDEAVKKYGMAFSKEDRLIANSLTNIASQIKSTNTVFDPVIGSVLGAGGAAAGGPAGAVAGFGAIYAYRFLANTESGRRALLAIGKMAADDPKLPAAVKALNTIGKTLQQATPGAVTGGINRLPQQTSMQ